MQVQHALQVWRRERTGSRYAQRERGLGRLPAVLYGHGAEPLAISLDHKEAMRFFHSGERIFDVQIAGESVKQTVMLKDIQFDYLGTNPVHVDLTRVDMDEVIEASIAIRFRGEAVGLKKANTILTHHTNAIKVKCRVRDLPDHFDVDISGLDAGQLLHISDIKLPASVELIDDDTAVIAAIEVVKEQAESETGEAAAVGEAAQPEVITERKKEEE